jgi:phage N-6-adenine-methyltransferase
LATACTELLSGKDKLTRAEVAEIATVAPVLSFATPREALDWTKEQKRNYRGVTTGDNEWYTPAVYIDLAREVLGGIDLDPASSELANATVQASTFYNAEDDGLTERWAGRVWINPPYAQPLIEQFVNKLTEEFKERNVSAAILLTNNYTDTAWFRTAYSVAGAICFTRGRVKFVDPDGKIAAPTQGQAFFYFGPNPAAFNRVFREIGFVVQPFGDDADGSAV